MNLLHQDAKVLLSFLGITKATRERFLVNIDWEHLQIITPTVITLDKGYIVRQNDVALKS